MVDDARCGGVSVPAPHWFCDGSQLGVPAIVMDFIPSTTLLSHLRDRTDLAADRLRLADVAAAIHSVSYAHMQQLRIIEALEKDEC